MAVCAAWQTWQDSLTLAGACECAAIETVKNKNAVMRKLAVILNKRFIFQCDGIGNGDVVKKLLLVIRLYVAS